MRTLLKTNNLSAGYPATTNVLLFDKLDLELKEGQLVCFMGPNGVGKSTLIRTLAGLQNSLGGSVELFTSSVGAVPIENNIPREIAVVLTDRITAMNMTVYDLVTYGRYPFLQWHTLLNERDIAIVDESIARINLKDIIHKKLYELSDGQLQMAMIARALAQDTPLILLDEPTAHLDLNNRVEIMKLLRELTRSTGKAILIATHDLDLALQTADLIWLTGKNKNMITGIPEDLVLCGVFDEIFQFKGFDLKTGKVQHDPYRKTGIKLTGEGYAFLWTKNALERNGFEVNTEKKHHDVNVTIIESKIQWVMDDHLVFFSVKELLNHLAEKI